MIIALKVGKGSRVSFLGEKLCGSLVLKDEFPALYSLSYQRELFVQQVKGTKGMGHFGISG